MNRRSLLKRAAALLVAPSLLGKLPAPAVAAANLPVAAGAGGTGEQMVVTSMTPTSFTIMRGATWLDDEIVPVYSQLMREHAADLDRQIWIGT